MHRRVRASAAMALLILLAGCAAQPQDVPQLQYSTVTVTVCDEAQQVQSCGETVGELLQRLDIPVAGSWRVSQPLDAPTYNGMQLRVDLYESRMEVCCLPAAFDTRYCYDPSLPAGEEEVLYPGAEGQMETVFAVDYVNGNACGYELQEQTLTVPPESRIVAVGTGERVGQERTWPLYGDSIIVVESGEVLTYTHSGQFSATAYTAWVADTTGTTATGTKARVGAIAVDPRVIPYGTRMFIVTNDGEYVYGVATAEDCGGAIKGNKVDLFFDTLEECYAFGRRKCTIYFLS